MLRKTAALLLTLILLLGLLAGCRTTDYLSVQEHVDPFSYRETTTTEETEQQLSASDYYSLRTVLLSLMTEGVEHAEILLDGYNGDSDADLKRVSNYLIHTDPVGAYAIDYINYEQEPTPKNTTVIIDFVYRRSANEIAAIRSVLGNAQADNYIYAALAEFVPSVTLQISGYTDEDFEQTVQAYCLNHPEKTVPCSEVSVSIYPDSGNVRVAEFHFSYELTKEELRTVAGDTATALQSAYNYMRYGQSAEDSAALALSYLVGRFDYEQSDSATVYSLLCEGICNSTAFASAFAYLCRNASIPCEIVCGTKDGVPYSWVMLQFNEIWYHFDVSQTVLDESRTLNLKTDSEMYDFAWDTEVYPACDGMAASSQVSEDG